MFRFEYPLAFLMLLVFPVFLALRRSGFFRKIEFPLTLSDWNGHSFSWKYSVAGIGTFLSRLLSTAGMLLCVASVASPVLSHQEKIYSSRGADIVFVVDVSPSMGGMDIGSSNRLDASVQTITTLVEDMAGTSFGIVAMASDAVLVVPPTMDIDYFIERLKALRIGELGDGTAIGTGLATAVYHLVDSNAPRKSIVLLTDGENNSGSIHPMTAAKLAAENGITLYTVAVGTQGTVSVEYTDPQTGNFISGFMDSAFDDTMLRNLAIETGGSCYSAESARTLYETLVSVSEQESVVQTYSYENHTEPLHFYFLQAAAACIILAWSIRRLYLKEVL